MAGRGRPRKNLVTGETEQAGKKDYESIPTSNVDDAVRFDFSEREALSKSYMENEYGFKDESEAASPAGTGESEVTAESASEAAEKTGSEAQEVKPSDETKIIIGATETGKDNRTVPYGALHEEREKRKALQRELEELKSKDFKQQDTFSDTGGLDDDLVYKSEVKRLEKKVSELEGKFVQEEKTKAEIEREKNVSKVDERLQEEGIVGFAEIGRHVVLRKLTEMYAEDPNYAIAHDNPEGWQKIYKEEYPKIQKVFVEKARTKTFEDKKALKSRAGLITNPGSNPIEEKQDEKKDLSYEDVLKEYSKNRSKFSL